jgi:hypothetical protein
MNSGPLPPFDWVKRLNKMSQSLFVEEKLEKRMI